MPDTFEPTTAPEEISRACPNVLTALWRVVQIDQDQDRFEQADIRLESRELDDTGIEVVADAMRERFNEHGSLRAEIARLRRDLKEAYRLVDTYYADMTDEASDDLEAHLVDSLEKSNVL